MSQHVTFKIRPTLNVTGLCLYTKKKDGWVSRREIADVVCEKLERNDIWPADIEDLNDIPSFKEDEIKRLFEVVDNDRKFYSN